MLLVTSASVGRAVSAVLGRAGDLWPSWSRSSPKTRTWTGWPLAAAAAAAAGLHLRAPSPRRPSAAARADLVAGPLARARLADVQRHEM